MKAILAAFLIAQQPPCGPTGAVEKRLVDLYGETVVGAGIVAGGVLFTTANPETGTFTLMLRRPDGLTCIIASGTGYAVQEAVKAGEDT